MCRFFSAIATKHGRLLYLDKSDSHEDIIHHFDLKDKEVDLVWRNWVRVEYSLKEDCTYSKDPFNWQLTVDEYDAPPDWLDMDKLRKQCHQAAMQYVFDGTEGQISYVRNKRIIMIGNAVIKDAVDCDIVMRDNASIKVDTTNCYVFMKGATTINRCFDSVVYMQDDSSIKKALDTSRIHMLNQSYIADVRDNVLIMCMRNDAHISNVYDDTIIKYMTDNAKIDSIHSPAAYVLFILSKTATIEKMLKPSPPESIELYNQRNEETK